MEFWGFVGGERAEEIRRQRVEEGSVQFSSVQDGIYALGKAHMCSSLSLRSFPNVTFEMVPMFV